MTQQNNMLFMGSAALLQASDIIDTESGDPINTATITLSIFDVELRYPVSILRFTSGGVLAIEVDDIIVGATGGATAVVTKVDLIGGHWAAGTAWGTLEINGQDGLFEGENLNATDKQDNIATIPAGDSSGLNAILLSGGKVRIPMNTRGLSTDGFIRIEGSKKYNGQFDIEVIDQNGSAEVQSSHLDAIITGGHFHLTYKGETTAEIAWNATTAEIKTALETLSTVDVDDITPEAAHEPDTEQDCDWTFADDLGDTPMLFMDISACTGATSMTWAEMKGGKSGFVTITHAAEAEVFTGDEAIYIGIVNGKDIAFTHEGGDDDGYYDGTQPSDLEGVHESVEYVFVEKIVYGGHTVLHKYTWAAGYYSNPKIT